VLTQIANIQEMDQYVHVIVVLTLNTYIVLIPFSKLFLNLTTKLENLTNDQTCNQPENVVTNATLIVNVRIKD
jgi:hypothetical protein